MANIQEKILEDFYLKLAVEGFAAEKVKQIRELFGESKRPKAADLIKVFADNSKESLP